MIEEILQSNLDEIAETFKDQVPRSYESLPVIRFQILESVPSLEGDDTFFSFRHFVQIDLYSLKKDSLRELQLEDFIRENHFKLTGKKPSLESGVNRVMYQITIEE